VVLYHKNKVESRSFPVKEGGYDARENKDDDEVRV
jgi:hypothetical protein